MTLEAQETKYSTSSTYKVAHEENWQPIDFIPAFIDYREVQEPSALLIELDERLNNKRLSRFSRRGHEKMHELEFEDFGHANVVSILKQQETGHVGIVHYVAHNGRSGFFDFRLQRK